VVDSEAEVVAADGQWASSGMRAQDRRSQGLAAAVDLSVRKRGSIDAKAFFSRRGSQKRGENDMPEVYDGPQRIPDLRGQCEKRT
jgi:hypothetical protein